MGESRVFESGRIRSGTIKDRSAERGDHGSAKGHGVCRYSSCFNYQLRSVARSASRGRVGNSRSDSRHIQMRGFHVWSRGLGEGSQAPPTGLWPNDCLGPVAIRTGNLGSRLDLRHNRWQHVSPDCHSQFRRYVARVDFSRHPAFRKDGNPQKGVFAVAAGMVLSGDPQQETRYPLLASGVTVCERTWLGLCGHEFADNNRLR
jgi:hypothetical protein